MLTLFRSCFIASKVTFIHFYLNGGLHAVSIEKPSERMSNFWTVRFVKIKSEPSFSFPHIPTITSTPTIYKRGIFNTVNLCMVNNAFYHMIDRALTGSPDYDGQVDYIYMDFKKSLQ